MRFNLNINFQTLKECRATAGKKIIRNCAYWWAGSLEKWANRFDRYNPSSGQAVRGKSEHLVNRAFRLACSPEPEPIPLPRWY